MRRRLTAAAFALLLCACRLPALAARISFRGYEDLREDAWYAQGVGYCMEKGIMSGYRYYGMRFFPENAVTRAQLAAILWRLEGSPATGLTMQYVDVGEGIWYEDAVRWAMAEDIMAGYKVTVFAPDDPVTREQFATALWRYARYRGAAEAVGEEPDFPDWDEASPYAGEALRWAWDMGILSGEAGPDGRERLAPDSPTTRAAAAVMLMRFCLDIGL